MKTRILGIILLSCVTSVLAIDKAELDDRIRTLTAKFDSLQRQPDKAIPAENLRKAQGIILLDRTKAGFIFAYQGGGGVAMVRDRKTGQWSPPAFMKANEASLGFQIGGEQSFFVILLMNTNSTRLLTESTFDFGGEARGTAGDVSSGAEGTITSPEPQVLVYDDRKGLYGGAAIKGGAVSPDEKADSIYYEVSVSTKEILFDKKVKPTESTSNMSAVITEYSKAKKSK
jgi:SH3 domain-containing YSC84-like protein 1